MLAVYLASLCSVLTTDKDERIKRGMLQEREVFTDRPPELTHTAQSCKWTDSVSASLFHHCPNFLHLKFNVILEWVFFSFLWVCVFTPEHWRLNMLFFVYQWSNWEMMVWRLLTSCISRCAHTLTFNLRRLSVVKSKHIVILVHKLYQNPISP